MLNPNQFQVDEAWLAFTLNDAPIRTVQDGMFNCVCLMDAASCFILGTAFVSEQESEPSEFEVRRLFETSLEHNKRLPNKLFIPVGQFQTTVAAEAQRQGVEVVIVREGELSLFTREAREAFRDHVQRKHTCSVN